MDRSIIVVFGPTATGKSRLAMRLAAARNGEIINADALQVYREFDVGTAKPTIADRRRVPHHLVDLLDPREAFSAGRFARLARAAISEIEGRGRQALVVGGSGFYLRALLEGLSPVPPTPREVRSRLRRDLEARGLEAMRLRLRTVDPEACSRIAPGDSQRVLRALEVWEATGIPLSTWQRREPPERPLAARKIGLTLPRAVLYDRIAARVDAMLAAGWVEEVETLLGSGLNGSEPAFQAIGYAQIVDHLREGTPLPLVRDGIVQATRQYAKRQTTWYRREGRVAWFSASDEEDLFSRVQKALDDPMRWTSDDQG